MIQSVGFTSAAFQAMPRHIYVFSSICGGKRNAEVFIFLGILKNMSPRIKYKFVQERKAMFRLKQLFLSFTQFSFSHNFVFHNLDFITQIIYCIIRRCLCSHFILFLFSYISLQEMEHTDNVNLSLFIQLAKVQYMFKKHRQDCEHPKNVQFDIYVIPSNSFNKFG